MEHPRKIDRSFKERLGILHLLDRLKKENITYAEMDEIGGLLRKAGRSAVQPLLRKLWREKNGNLISKYTYLLDFLDYNFWFDQIIQIALKRRDLELEGKSAILETLRDCGIDVTIPPFSTLLLDSVGKSLAESFPNLMNKGAEGLLWFMEDFDSLPFDMKRPFLAELSRLDDPRVLDVFKLLLWYDELSIAGDVVDAVGRIRLPEAVSVLEEFLPNADPSLHGRIERSLRRLAFLRVPVSGKRGTLRRLSFHSAYASPVDGAGYRHLWVARRREDGRLDTINLQVHDVSGIMSVWGDTGESVEKYEADSAARIQEELVEQVTPGYALQVISDAVFNGRENGQISPPAFYIFREMFAPHEISPVPYEPPCVTWQVKVTPMQLALSAELFEDEFFAGWYHSNCRVYEMAEEWIRLEKENSGERLAACLERLVERFCHDELKPELKQISRRLFLNADYLARIGLDGQIVKTTLAAAQSIREFQLPCHMHPFLRRFAMESLIAAREALDEGYDLRDHPEDEDWE